MTYKQIKLVHASFRAIYYSSSIKSFINVQLHTDSAISTMNVYLGTLIPISAHTHPWGGCRTGFSQTPKAQEWRRLEYEGGPWGGVKMTIFTQVSYLVAEINNLRLQMSAIHV